MAPAAWRQPLTPVNQPHRPISVPCACVLSRFCRATPRTTAHQASPSMGFSSQEHWSVLPCPSPGDRPNPGIEPASLKSCALANRFFTTGTAWEARPKKTPLFLLIIILTAYSHAGIPQSMCPGSDRPLHCLCTWAAAGPLPDPGRPSCSCLKSSVTSMHAPLSQSCASSCSLLCGRVPSSCLSPPSPETPPLSHSLEGAFPHPAASATPRPAITPGSSPPGMSPFRVHLPSLSTPRGSLPTQWSWITLRTVGWGAGLCCPPLSGPVGVLFVQSHPGARDLWRRAQYARKVGHYANARDLNNSH